MNMCNWCNQAIEEIHTAMWREVNGKIVDATFLHWECEEEFLEVRAKTGWHEKVMEAPLEIYIDRKDIGMAAWRGKKAEEAEDIED